MISISPAQIRKIILYSVATNLVLMHDQNSFYVYNKYKISISEIGLAFIMRQG